MTTSTIPYTTCPHTNITDSLLACQLWCELQELTTGAVCTNKPTCPYENYTSPHDADLCALWAENVNLKDQIYNSSSTYSTEITPLFGSTDPGSQTIPCKYANIQHQSEYCSLWCEIQYMKYGQSCGDLSSTTALSSSTTEPCPYLAYTNSAILCDLWEKIQEAESASTTSGASLTTSTVPYTTCPHTNITDDLLACEFPEHFYKKNLPI